MLPSASLIIFMELIQRRFVISATWAASAQKTPSMNFIIAGLPTAVRCGIVLEFLLTDRHPVICPVDQIPAMLLTAAARLPAEASVTMHFATHHLSLRLSISLFRNLTGIGMR